MRLFGVACLLSLALAQTQWMPGDGAWSSSERWVGGVLPCNNGSVLFPTSVASGYYVAVDEHVTVTGSVVKEQSVV